VAIIAAATTGSDTAVCCIYLTYTIHCIAYQMGGKEAAAIIRQHNKHVPIIFLTGEIAATMKESTKQFAPAHLLLKPCNKLTLIAVSTLTDTVHLL
jgi:CheY-like chemotaxis protein